MPQIVDFVRQNALHSFVARGGRGQFKSPLAHKREETRVRRIPGLFSFAAEVGLLDVGAPSAQRLRAPLTCRRQVGARIVRRVEGAEGTQVPPRAQNEQGRGSEIRGLAHSGVPRLAS